MDNECLILWSEQYTGFKLKHKEHHYDLWAKCEVVGNKFDNPELLKEAK